MFRTIVAGASKTAGGRTVAQQAVELANLCGAQLHLVSVYDPDPSADRPVVQHAEAFLDSLTHRAEGGFETHVRTGDPAEVILSVAAQQDADLIVVGNKGMQGVRRVLSSVPKEISHRADCAVLILATS